MKKAIAVFFLLLIGICSVVSCKAKIHKGETKDGATYQYNTKK